MKLAIGAILATGLLGAALQPALSAYPPNGPLRVVDGWGGAGGVAVLAFFLSCALGYVVLRRLLISKSEHAGRVALLFAVGLGLALASWRIAFSSDAYAYAAYGELARLGRSPYVPMPAGALAGSDALLRGAWTHWPDGPPPSVYGPLFVAFADGVVRFACAVAAGPGEAAEALTLGGFRAVALVSVAAAAAALASLLPPRRRAGAALFAAHPVVIWSALEGHNDALALALSLGGGAVALRLARGAAAGSDAARRIGVAAGMFAPGLAGLVKAPGLSTLPFLIALFGTPRTRPFSSAAALGASAGIALALVAGLPAQAPALQHLARHSRYHPADSFQGILVALAARLAGHPIPLPGDVALGSILGLIPAALLAVAALRSLFRAAPAGGAAGALLLGMAAYVALPNPQPWYATWFAALAAGMLLRDDGRISTLALGLWGATFSVAVRYLPDAAAPLDDGGTALVVLVELLPIGVALLAAYGPRRTPEIARS